MEKEFKYYWIAIGLSIANIIHTSIDLLVDEGTHYSLIGLVISCIVIIACGILLSKTKPIIKVDSRCFVVHYAAWRGDVEIYGVTNVESDGLYINQINHIKYLKKEHKLDKVAITNIIELSKSDYDNWIQLN